MAMNETSFVTTKQSSVFFIPNLLDYFRIFLLILTIAVFCVNHWLAICLYILNSSLDMLDGTLARLLKQQSKLGALLDFSIDRAAIAILLSTAIVMLPRLWGLFVTIMALDIMTHFAICYATAWNGGSHLNFISEGSNLLKWFSQKSWVRYCICTSHDTFFAVFIFNYLAPSQYWLILWALFAPGMLLKTWIHLEQFYLATKFAAWLDHNN